MSFYSNFVSSGARSASCGVGSGCSGYEKPIGAAAKRCIGILARYWFTGPEDFAGLDWKPNGLALAGDGCATDFTNSVASAGKTDPSFLT